MARLTAAERNALPDSAFADPAHRAYPMEDAAHRKAAGMLVGKYGSEKQRAQVHAKLRRSRLGKVKA